jgi:hypothetical protein
MTRRQERDTEYYRVENIRRTGYLYREIVEKKTSLFAVEQRRPITPPVNA